MNRYKITVRSDKDYIIEAETIEQAKQLGLDADDRAYSYNEERFVWNAIDLTDDPIDLLEELAMELEASALRNDFCKYCAVPRSGSHSVDCIIERARYCIREHRRKADEDHTD